MNMDDLEKLFSLPDGLDHQDLENFDLENFGTDSDIIFHLDDENKKVKSKPKPTSKKMKLKVVKKIKKTKTSRYSGVSRNNHSKSKSKIWRTSCSLHPKVHRVGDYVSEIEAAKAYISCVRMYCPKIKDVKKRSRWNKKLKKAEKKMSTSDPSTTKIDV